jgi:hypothetical protein
MNFDTSNNSQKILIEDDKSLLMFENKEIILVGQFKNGSSVIVMQIINLK